MKIAFFTETFLPRVDGIVTRLTNTVQHPVPVRLGQGLGAAVGARSYSKEFELEADALGTGSESRF